MTEPPAMPPVCRKAVAGFVLGLLAIPLNLFAALSAIVIGLSGLREINCSEGRLSGRWMSITGMVLGGLVVVVDGLGGLAVVVFNVRHTSYRVECTNNLRQIGLAVNMYLTDHEFFPPGTIQNSDLLSDQRLSWLVSLLPYYIDMEAERRRTSREVTPYFNVYAGIDRAQAWDAPSNREATARYLRVFVCPVHPAFDDEPSPGPTYYVGTAGMGANAASLPLVDPNSGFFGYDRKIMPDDVTRGVSYTMMATETARHNGPWAQGGFATVRGLDTSNLPFTGQGRPFGGLHPRITNILYADASVQPFRSDAPPDQFAALATLKRDGD